jgi:hypothetical protein
VARQSRSALSRCGAKPPGRHGFAIIDLGRNRVEYYQCEASVAAPFDALEPLTPLYAEKLRG